MINDGPDLEILCIGASAYDLIFTIPRDVGVDEKLAAEKVATCGGGPAANAAVAAARLGLRAGYAGWVGQDLFGTLQLNELRDEGVDTRWVVRLPLPTPISVVLVKPDGSRSLVNYGVGKNLLPADTFEISLDGLRVLLGDGHEPELCGALFKHARGRGIPVVLDAGSLNPGTRRLADQVDHLVCSERFAVEATGRPEPQQALAQLASRIPTVVITLGQRGLVWQHGSQKGTLPAFELLTVDTTGAGDAFHGAYCAGVARGLPFEQCLQFASAAGALCCTRLGARPGLPRRSDVEGLLSRMGLQANIGQP
jgi:sulfofructose kinase